MQLMAVRAIERLLEDGCGYPHIIRGKRRADSHYKSRGKSWLAGEGRVTRESYRGHARMRHRKRLISVPEDGLIVDEVEDPVGNQVAESKLACGSLIVSFGCEPPTVASMISPQSLQQLQRLII